MKRIILTAIMATGMLIARGETIQLTPGGLSTALGEQSATVTTLTLTGEGDARDLAYAASLPALKTLDISGMRIVELQGREPVLLSRRHYQADALPAFVFALSKIETVVLPATLTHIEECAFASSALKQVTMGAALKRIDQWAFYNSALTAITLPASVDSLGDGVFADCRNLAEATLTQAKIATLPVKTFRGCTSLRTVVFPTAMTALGAESLLGSGLETLNLPAQIRTVGEYALSGMPKLKEYSASNPQLGIGALYGNSALTSIIGQTDFSTLSIGATPALQIDSAESHQFRTLDAYALAGNGTKTLNISDKLTYVGEHALEGMGNLRHIWAVPAAEHVPETATGAFDGLENPRNIVLSVLKNNHQPWLSHPEWSRFYVTQCDITSVESIENGSDITCHLADDMLKVTAGETISSVSVCTSAGTMVAASSPRSTEAHIDLSAVDDRIILVRVATTTATRTFKLQR